jgi:hypothetical protein
MADLFIPYRDSAQGKPTAWMTPFAATVMFFAFA